MSEQQSGGFGWFILGFLVGGLAGATVALAYAPESGEETRERLRLKGIELRGQAEQVAGKARGRVDELRRQAEEQVGSVRSQVEQGVQAARGYAENVSNRMQRGKTQEGDDNADIA